MRMKSHMKLTKQKRTGSHFTPLELATVVAERLIRHMPNTSGKIRILDPACGEGNLLLAIAEQLPPDIRKRCVLVGIEDDRDSYSTLCDRLAKLSGCKTDLIQGDFLDFFDDRTLLDRPSQSHWQT